MKNKISQLEKLSELEFKLLKDNGILFEFFPNAPEFYNQIIRRKNVKQIKKLSK